MVATKRAKEAEAKDDDGDKRKGNTRESRQESIIKASMNKNGIGGTVKQTTVTIGLETIWRHSDEEGMRVYCLMEHTVSWVSRVVPLLTLFLNWLVLDIISTVDRALPLLNARLYLELLYAITDKPSPYTDGFRRFCKATGHTSIEWMSRTNRVMEHKRNEMVTAAQNMLLLQFGKRRIGFLRWKLADVLSTHLETLDLKRRKQLLFNTTNRIIDACDNGDEQFLADLPDLPQVLVSEICSTLESEKERMASLRREITDRVKNTWVAKRAGNKKQKISSEELALRFDQLPTLALLKEDPMSILRYHYNQFQSISDLNLTRTVQACTSGDDFMKALPWKWRNLQFPSFSPLPFSATKRQFIRVDEKTLVNDWRVQPRDDVWWMEYILQLYRGGRQRIHQLKACDILSDPRTAAASLDLLNCRPYLPGASFTTDAVSLHMSLFTYPSPHDNLDGLDNRGYTGIKAESRRSHRLDVLTHRNGGVHKLESCVMSNNEASLLITDFVSVDPGVVEVVAGVGFNGSDIARGRHGLITAAMANSTTYSQERYVKNTDRGRAQDHEAKRRVTNEDYGRGCQILSVECKRTFELARVESYARARAQADPLLRSELLDSVRSLHRRRGFVKGQKCIGHMVHTVLNEPGRHKRRMMRRNGTTSSLERRKVVFFGRALFTGVKGHVTVPRKKLIRALACRALVVLVDEFNTSKLCPYDFRELADGQEIRVRLCQIEHNGNGPFSCNRDLIGAANIGQKAIWELKGQRLERLYQSSVVVVGA